MLSSEGPISYFIDIGIPTFPPSRFLHILKIDCVKDFYSTNDIIPSMMYYRSKDGLADTKMVVVVVVVRFIYFHNMLKSY